MAIQEFPFMEIGMDFIFSSSVNNFLPWYYFWDRAAELSSLKINKNDANKG